VYTATMTREVQEEGRTLSYFALTRDRDGKLVGFMVCANIQIGENKNAEFWYVDSDKENPKREMYSNRNECFKRAVRAWKNRGG